MKSLRSRLILGVALIAIVPLVIVVFVLSRRVETMVRTEATERLEAALGGLRARLEEEGVRDAEKLGILGRDPTLKRLYLVRGAGPELVDDLERRRFMLDLDVLQVVDASGAVMADGDAAHAIDLSAMSDVEPPTAIDGRRALVPFRTADGEGLALIASAPIVYEGRAAGLVRGGRLVDAAYLATLKQAYGIDLVLRTAGGRILASTLAGGSTGSQLLRSLPLAAGETPGATLEAVVSTAAADRTVATLQTSAVALGVAGLVLAVVLGLLWSSQVSRPVERLAKLSEQLAHGELDEPINVRSVRELQTMVAALERMRGDLVTYRAKLVTSERQAAWSQMARQVAHEIKNPLTPIAISIADLQRSFDQQRADFPQILDRATKTIAEEVERLKRLLQEFSDFGRFPAPTLAPCSLAAVLADLETLYARDVADGRLRFERDGDATLHADAGQLRQALVNLVKNALEATDGAGRVTVSAKTADTAAEIAVADDGPGLTAEQRANLFVPGLTTKPGGSGLGLTIVEKIVNDHGGTIAADESTARGTTFRVRLPLAPRT